MKIGLHRATWVANYPPATLSQLTDSDTLQRATASVQADRVRTAVAASDGNSIMATVRPLTSKRVEHVRINYDSATNELSGTCSCHRDSSLTEYALCEHQLAVILCARANIASEKPYSKAATDRSQPRATAATRRAAKQPATKKAPTPPNPHRKAVALEVDVVGGEHVMLRPLRPAGNGWRASGNGWRDFTNPHGVRWATDDQADAIFDLYQLFLAASRATFAYGSRKVFVETLGAGLWKALAAAKEAGVQFVAGLGLPAERVELAAQVATPQLDLTRTADRALSVQFLCGKHTGPGGRIIPLGRPMHGALVINRRGALLQPLAGSLIPDVRAIAAAGVRYYPPGDVPHALAHDIPRLALHVPLISSDDSVDLPAVTRPDIHLRAEVVADTKPHVALTWQIATSGIAPVILASEIAPELLRAARLAAPEQIRDLLPSDQPEVRSQANAKECVVAWQTRAEGAEQVRAVRDVLLPWAGDARGITLETIELQQPDQHASKAEVVISAPKRDVATSQAAWLDLDIEVRIAGEVVAFELVFRALVSEAERLYLPGGQWVDLTSSELDALRTLIAATKDLTAADAASGRVSVSSFDVQAARAVEQIGGVDDERTLRWIDNLNALANTRIGELGDAALTAPVQAELREYQTRGINWALALMRAQLGGILADDMGLGKTLQMLTVIAQLRADNPNLPPVLVIAPTSVISGWVEQGLQFTPQLRIHALTRSLAASGEDLGNLAASVDVLITSYALARIDADALEGYEFSLLLLDEAQFVKNPTSKTFHAIRKIPARTTIAMTGTPLENSLLDLWAIFTLVAPGLLGTRKDFQTRFRAPLENDSGDDAARRHAHGRLRELIAPFMLRRTKSQVASELPEKQEQVLSVALSAAHQRRYDEQLQIERQHVLGLLGDADRNRVRILKSLTTLRRLALDPRLAPPQAEDGAEVSDIPDAASAKTETLLRYLREVVAEGHRVLVFSQFTTYLQLIASELEEAGLSYCYLDGSTRNRGAEIERFRGGVPIFLISLKAGGFGLNLTEADYVFMMDPWWNPAAEEQAIDRTHRIGQTRPVNVYRLVAAGTIEEKVLALQERKRQLFADVIGDGQAFGSGKLSVEDIRSLLDEH